MNKLIQNIINISNHNHDYHDNRIDWDDYFISTALLISCRSPCERLHVGCILVYNNRIISAGYNGFLPGALHKSIVMTEGSHTHEQATVHAECNAIADCANRGVSTVGATAYITHYPCINCFKILVAAGIREIKYLHDYKNDLNVEQLIKSMISKHIVLTKLN
jgi:dCMP deaminase